jgi:aminomethyltransferase
MVDFAGWEMPLLYTGITEEHLHTRSAASVFDVSHMGRIEVHGPDALPLLQLICTRQLGDARVGQSRYSHVCNPEGGILDDVIVSRYEEHWLVVCNASNRERILSWIREHARDLDVDIRDTTETTLMVAVQGPEAILCIEKMLPVPFSVSELKRYHFRSGVHMFVNYTIFRSGYTGEDGVELILPAMVGSMFTQLFDGTEARGLPLRPAGLGARDTLRLEAGMPLYGHELTEQTNTISAGLGWCVDLSKEFIGVERLRAIDREGPSRRLAGLELEGRRIARQGTEVFDGDQPVGVVTSGTFSPTLQRSIAMAYVEASCADAGRSLTIPLGTKSTAAVVVPLPFYKRKRS